MDSATEARLLEINRRFYLEHAPDFAATRERVQPGIERVLDSLGVDETVLDLGCGNGALARALSQRGHKGAYLGLDFSPALLERARASDFGFPVAFIEVDLSAPAPVLLSEHFGPSKASSHADVVWPERWTVIAAFAVLHHLPGQSLRRQLLARARDWLLPNGRLILSVWQFSASARMESHMLPWATAGVEAGNVDEGDYLVDWRRGSPGTRYVHEFRESELAQLAAEAGFRPIESFRSDGADHRSGLYQIWQGA